MGESAGCNGELEAHCRCSSSEDLGASVLVEPSGAFQRSIAKYVGCLKQVKSLRQSGTKEHDIMKKALALYKERNKHHFAYIECYDVLSKCPKFEQALDKLVDRPRSGKRKSSEPEPELSSGNTTSATPSASSVTAAERPSKGLGS
ncbi:hypothetical protein PHYPSEUDO_013113 [Phytophthora pseudosyringae]|uniref:No apical meristem-associated C-terminal domain-containing protein n=1 Tax=Phytophthora pseudosyringae TaxID=221518 RepID=A0A8T1V6E0_9STRA|nr:hypothetical protein PHYPSEUDO_013113 [Phytophthora pseudosyringae]